ncbi:MAG: L-histidine N(alpha)-methyltransferase, partial [Deltaproteobacteria bacterium]
DIDLLMRAYNDSAGVTAAFNLNLLARINRELGGTFDLATFRHRGTYNFVSGAMESYLISEKAQSVFIESLSASFDFAPWEAIHTESSQKYLLSEIEALAAETGFVVETHLFDRRRYFTDSIWRVVKRGGG